MKNIILIMTVVFALPSFAQDFQFNVQAKEIITEAIGEHVYYEDEGFERLPQGQEDFKFNLVEKNKIIVTGKSLSEWDMQDIEYYCEINILSDGLIEKIEDIEVDFCTLEGENWPYM
jgi:hypothetical protein